MIMPPCKENGIECPDRQIGCQGKCPKMVTYYEKLEKARENERRQKQMDSYRKDTAVRLKNSSGCVPSVILKNKVRSQERRANPYGKVIKKDKPTCDGTGG